MPVPETLFVKFQLQTCRWCGTMFLYTTHLANTQSVLRQKVIYNNSNNTYICKQHEKTIDLLTSGCPILAQNKYFMRHDKVCAHFHYSICKSLGIETTNTHTHTHTHKPVSEEMLQYYEMKGYAQPEKLQHIGQVS
jgi:hypothetical protein